MPYTPPNRSPASSAPSSPDVSRRSSLQSGNRPSLPRSASYLYKHRRTPSASASDGSAGTLTPQGTSEDLQAMLSTAIRQSPPPLTDDRGMPKLAIISPPDSASSDSEEESEPTIRGRKIDRLKDLREAVSQIPQQRTPSPDRKKDEKMSKDGRKSSVHLSFSTNALCDLGKPGRRNGHVRSATEPFAGAMKPADNSTTSEEETDEDGQKKPQMVRKKSGELVRPALRLSRRRPSSMPGTPTLSKAVHFDSHLEHVRHFLQVDRPLAVSAGSSPVDNYTSDTEYPFPAEEGAGGRSPPYEWEILTANFPHDTAARKSMPVRLERVWLSSDQKTMLGSVAVANLAFEKSVTCRFTLDYWKTTSEVAAEYSHEIRPHESPLGHDRFIFSIKLADTVNLESKTLFFCVRYCVNGQEFWDNNSTTNFQVDFRKKFLPQNGKKGTRGASSRPLNNLPRSSRRGGVLSRAKSVPSAFEDFGGKMKMDQSLHEYLGESDNSGLRFKSKSASSLGSDDVQGLNSPSGLAFSNRYDFGASLSAAVQASKDTFSKDKDNLYMKPNVRDSKPSPPLSETRPTKTKADAASQVPGTGSPASLPSSSYEELVNKYCFFGTKQSSPSLKDGTLDSPTSGKNASSTGSGYRPYHYNTSSAAHHTLRLHNANPAMQAGSPPIISVLGDPVNIDRSAVARSAPPTFSGFDGSAPADIPYQMMDRFPWTDAQATAIRG